MIIGIGCQARVGKDSVADHFVRHHGFNKLPFAYTLKRAAQFIFGFTHEQIHGSAKERVDPFWEDTPRNVLQKMGTECMRNGYRQDIWVKAAFKKIHEADPEGTKDWVMPDVRFPDEADAIKSVKGRLLRIDRPSHGDGVIATKSHVSETALKGYDGWDHVITNDGTLEELFDKANAWLEQVKLDALCSGEMLKPSRTMDYL